MTSRSAVTMEDILHQLVKDVITPKFASIKHTANTALDILQDEEKLVKIEAWELREICLHPILLALESRARKLGHTALAGIQVMFKDERFRSPIETSDEDKWLPSQVLSVLAVAHSLSEDLQIEVMKLLLNMTVTASWCTSAKTITKIAQVYIGSYQNCVMVQGAVQAGFITMLSKFVGGLVELEETVQDVDRNDVLADFKANSKAVPTENLINEVVLILTFLTDRLEIVASTGQGTQTLPLLLEGVNTVLTKVQTTIRHNSGFQELLWQRLCPCLISLLGEPKAEKVSSSLKPGRLDVARSTGKSTSSSNITQATAKVIYSIAGDLASLVGGIPPLRPVLESLFHKILMFPLPQNRLDALKVLKELLSEPQKVVSLIGSAPASVTNGDADSNSMGLMKMLVESIQQSSHLSDPAIVYTCVSCICGLLASLDRIRLGEAVADSMLKPLKGSRTHTRRSMTSNPDDDGGSDLTCDLYDDSQDVAVAEPMKESNFVDSKSPAEEAEGSRNKPVSPCQSPIRVQFEAEERENARQFFRCLQQLVPELMNSLNSWEVDESLQDLAARFCSNLPQNRLESQHAKSVSGVVLNSDGVYVAAITILKLNLQLLNCGYYTNRQNVPVSENDFLNEIFSSGLLLYLPPAWLKELYSQVLSSSLLGTDAVASSSTSRVTRSSSPLINLLQDLEGVGTTEERGRLLSDFREMVNPIDGDESDRARRAEVGKCLAASVLSACWAEMLDILSVMLNEQVPITGSGGMTWSSLSLLLATDSAQEDVRRARSSICASLDGFQRAAKLCCVLGLQQLCGSAFSQLARTSCVKEDFRSAAVAAESKVQSKTSVLTSSSKPKLIKLHAAHLLSMDVVMTTGLEIGSHSADCWKHVFRCCAHISELEHIYFSQGNNQSGLPKVLHGSQMESSQELETTEADGFFLVNPARSSSADLYLSPVEMAAIPMAPRINVPALIQQSGLESGWDNSLAAGGLLTFNQASKVLCGLSQEVDSFFEDAADKLCLDALLSMISELGEAMLIQLQKLGGSRETIAGGGMTSTSTRPPTNALHLYRLQQVLVRVVNSPRPLLHLLKVWSVVSPYLVQATGNSDHVISKMAVTSIHEFIVSLVSQREERPYFHVNEFVCKMFEDMLCLELCDGDVQDQIVCCICELVEACSSQLQSGWRPLFGALRSVKIEYTTNETVNEARQRHIAAVMDVFDVYLGMDNIAVFASATVDCVLCLLKYVHGPATFDSDFSADRSDSGSDDGYGDAEGELENLCVPALTYLTRVCDILASMWQMPACPVFKGAHRIQVDSASRFVDGDIPFMNFKDFAEEFSLDKFQASSYAESSSKKDEKLHTEQSKDSSASATQEQSGQTVLSSEPPESPDGISEDKPVVSQEIADDERKRRTSLHNVDMPESEGLDADVSRPINGAQGSDNSIHDPNVSLEVSKVFSVDETGDMKGGQSAKESKAQSDILSELPAADKRAPKVGGDNEASHKNLASSDKGKQLLRSKSLDMLDNESGVLHVWFLLIDGLVSAINHCPKTVQSNVLTTLIDLLRSAATVPGPEFSMHCLNHLLLPMMQSWLRRGSRCYGYWNTGINSFKQCCGLVADLVVEFVAKFSDQADLEECLQLILKQTFDVFIECVAQPVENISRLGCSCIRHILLTAGPHLSEQLWQVGALAVRRALNVSTYNLQLLMALFHPNSDNFYGDIGQVKVATRKDCTVVDCLRLRQMARQVFLLDSQVSSMPDVLYDTDQDKSFVFLLYPPGHQDSLNPDHISTRVPFRHVIVGLLSNQLLLQTVGSVLLEQNSDEKKVDDKHRRLPGLMSFMSTRNIYQFLSALEDVFQLAQDFDARPGLKFLLQKVACLEVAANLYKQMATALLFHMHALIEICAHLENSSIDTTRAAILSLSETLQSPEAPPSSTDLKHLASTSLAKPWTDGQIFLPLLQSACEKLCESYIEVLQDAGKGSVLDKMSERPIFFLTAQHDDISQITSQAQLAAQKARMLKQQSSRSSEAHKSKLGGGDSHHGTGGEGMVSVAATSPQAHDGSDEDADSEEEEKGKDSTREVDEDEERLKSKRELRAEMQSKVYTVATDQVIENLMNQYKRHKHQRSMPNFIRSTKLHKTKQKIPRREAVDEAIDKQQMSSIMKDSEAHIQAWSDSLTAILQMTMNLSDQSFSALLPVTFTLMSQLILHASDSALRGQLAQCFNRLGRMYDFSMHSASNSCGSSQ